MATQITNYKCPACTGPLHFVGESGRLECDYCGSTYDVAQIEAMYAKDDAKAEEAMAAQAEKDGAASADAAAESGWDYSAVGSDWGADSQSMIAYNCPSCGAELICEETTAATCCPYCGNPAIVPGKLGGNALKPDYIIPFKLDKQAAIAALKKHYQGKKLLPKSFTESNHLEEIKAIYVPFWLFDGQADGDISYHATRSFSVQEGDYLVTTTEHYNVRRAGHVSFERIPVDASSKMPDDYMDSIEPFDYSELQPFSTAYLPGFLADKYDVPAEDCAVRADQRATQTTIDALSDTVSGYESCTPTSSEINLRRGQVKYALCPVWMLNTKWNGKNYMFAMNGQTGKMVGDLPVSKGKFWGWFGGVWVLSAAVIALIMLFLNM